MVRSKVKIGVLALQGDFAEHISVLDNLNVNCTIVKKPNELSDINGLIIPGGESTTIKKLIDRYDFEGEIKEVKSEGRVDSLEQNFDLKSLNRSCNGG